MLASIGLIGLCPRCWSGDLLSALTAPHPSATLPGVQRTAAPATLGARFASGFGSGAAAPSAPPAGSRVEGRSETPTRAAEQDAAPIVSSRRPLDLSPPDIKPETGTSSEIPFPARPHAAGEAAPAAQATEAPEFHFQGSRVRQFAERFHREGLPVARLWETHSALLSLGLNQRGKPGLWLIQKTH